MKAPSTLKEALQLALAQQEHIERQQEQLQQQALDLANATAQCSDAGHQAQQKLAYLFEEGMAMLSISKTKAYKALSLGMVDTYVIGRRRYVTREALIKLRDRLERSGYTEL